MASRRTNYSIDEKREILKKYDEMNGILIFKWLLFILNSGVFSQRQISHQLKISRSVLQRIVNSRPDLGDNYKNPSSKRLKTAANKDIDGLTIEWIEKCLLKGIRLNQDMILNAARRIANNYEITDFTASQGWLWRFKNRHGIIYKKACGESRDADTLASENFKSNFPEITDGWDPENIYNADETGIFFRATPDGSLVFKKDKLFGSKKALDRMTVLLCSNMDGSHKLPLLVIGKSAKPRSLRGVNLERLNVTYAHSKKAWMTSYLWIDWIRKLDNSLNKKILLFIDNCSAHPDLDGLKNITFIFLPKNTTSLNQPMDMGIIRCLKSNYRRSMMQKILDLIDIGDINQNETAIDISRKFTILSAIRILSDSWKEITNKTIANCFKKAGFIKNNNSNDIVYLQEEDYSYYYQEISNNEIDENFIDVDNNLTTRSETDNQLLLDQVIENCGTFNADEKSNSSDEDIVDEKITRKDALMSIDKLERFCLKNNFDSQDLQYLSKIHRKISMIKSPKIQTKIEDFLK